MRPHHHLSVAGAAIACLLCYQLVSHDPHHRHPDHGYEYQPPAFGGWPINKTGGTAVATALSMDMGSMVLFEP